MGRARCPRPPARCRNPSSARSTSRESVRRHPLLQLFEPVERDAQIGALRVGGVPAVGPDARRKASPSTPRRDARGARNIRKGFFELEVLHRVLAHLPTALRPMIEFAYITGWRIPSEVLTLEWRQVDLRAGEVRLDP